MDKLKASYGSDSSTSDKSAGDAGNADGTGAVTANEVRGVILIPVYELWHKASKRSTSCPSSPTTGSSLRTTRLNFAASTLAAPAEPDAARDDTRPGSPVHHVQGAGGGAEPHHHPHSKLIVALKIRGAYDAQISELADIIKADDNEMKPIQEVAVLYAQNGNIERALWIMPIDKLVGVLQQLYTQRQQIKQIIFEITGLADIMRGRPRLPKPLARRKSRINGAPFASNAPKSSCSVTSGTASASWGTGDYEAAARPDPVDDAERSAFRAGQGDRADANAADAAANSPAPDAWAAACSAPRSLIRRSWPRCKCRASRKSSDPPR